MAENISMAPAPSLVRAALEHCEMPITYNDDYTVVVPEGDDLKALLQASVNLAMTKHVEDTMVLPSNIARLTQVSDRLRSLCRDMRVKAIAFGDDLLVDELNEHADTLDNVGSNLTPKERT